ncbi:MAG TPA: hypothetical protein VHO84_02820 [Syntrophorhabdaceae bacterium]|nr:hypothetical protein [Syntrophorhabdaceae bacterium]
MDPGLNRPIESTKITKIVTERLIRAPEHVRSSFPLILRTDEVISTVISQPDHLIVAFFTRKGAARVKSDIAREIDPLPGLITTGKEKAACRIKEAIHVTVRSCAVSNSFTFSLGQDSAILLEDHHQVFETEDTGLVSYTIPLAYILSYGNSITPSNIYDYLDRLIQYSVNYWTETTLFGRIQSDTLKNSPEFRRILN